MEPLQFGSLVSSFILCLALLSSEPAQSDEPVNLVVFLSDDLGRLDTSIHGSVDARTPTMDRLAADGMVFDNAYVASPSCCPNRYSFFTGLMPARHGAHPNHTVPKEDTKYLTTILKDLRYHVASFGKVSHGRVRFPGGDYFSAQAEEMHEKVIPYFDNEKINGPVCLLVGDRRPHVAWSHEVTYNPDEVTLPSFLIDTPKTREHWARYLTDVTGMDAEMGRIYNFAKEKFGDNFIFLFTSDHGGQWPRGKWNLYDYGTRVPMVVVWPGHIEPGTRTNAMTSWVDLLPTLIDAAGGKVPWDIDGRSFKSVLLGESEEHREKIFTTHTGDNHMNIFPMRSLRIGKYKYIHNLCPDAYHTNHSDRLRKDGAGAYWDSWDELAKKDSKAAEIVKHYYTRKEFEFFDLEKDPLELNNLAGNPEYTGQVKEMRAELAAWAKSQGDGLLPHREPYSVSEPIPVFVNGSKTPVGTSEGEAKGKSKKKG
jgi:arylsulfatase A-like enzyme